MKIEIGDGLKEKGFIITTESAEEEAFLESFCAMYENTNGKIDIDYNVKDKKFVIRTFEWW